MAISRSYATQQIQGQITANGYETYDQFGSEVIGLSNGGYAVVYGTVNEAIVGDDFPLVTIYDSTFTEIGSFTNPATSGRDMIGDPEIIELANGNLAVIWDEGPDHSGTNDVVGAIIDPTNGSIVHSEFVVSGFSVDSDPEAAALANGEWVVAMSSGSSIWMQRMDSSGNQIGGLFSTGVGTDFDPAIAALADGGWVVTYTSNDGGTVENSIFGTIYNANGSVRVDDFEIGFNFASNDNTKSAVAALNNGGWVVVYKDSGWAGDGISLHIYDANGNELSGPLRVDTDSTPIEDDPDVTVLENGMIVVSWTDPAGNGNILARVFDESGVVVEVNGSTDPFVITSTGTADTDSSISAINAGLFVNTWSDTNPDSDGDSISSEVNELVQTIVSDATGDTVVGSALRDSMFGNNGEDVLFGVNGDDSLYGGDQGDTVSGGNGNDEVYGGSGIDLVLGGAGNDSVYGGDNSDTISGGSGNDLGNGDGGNDLFYGAAGNDTIYGGTGSDTMAGGDDNDFVYGGAQGDSVFGQNNDDFIFGDSGNDLLSGGDGNDTLYGGNNADLLLGGTGNDDLYSGSGTDTMVGGFGQDRYFYSVGNQADVIQGFTDDFDALYLDDALWSPNIFTAGQVLASFATQVSPGIIDFDFGGGDTLRIINGSGISLAELEDDIFII